MTNPVMEKIQQAQKTSGRSWIGIMNALGEVEAVPRRVDFQVNFTFLFHEVYDYLVNESRISHSAIGVLARVMRLFSSGSLIGISQAELAKSMNMDRSTVNKAWQELRKFGVFVESPDGVSEHINVNLAYYGSPKDLYMKIGQEKVQQDLWKLLEAGVPAKAVVHNPHTREELR